MKDIIYNLNLNDEVTNGQLSFDKLCIFLRLYRPNHNKTSRCSRRDSPLGGRASIIAQ